MAERRMFARTIIDSDAFLDMPSSSQCLYFHLAMRADDDGFINNPKKIQRVVGSSDDDLKLLIAKKFIIPFESGIVVIKHWKIHNYIRADRKKDTVYTKEMELLTVKDNGSYTLNPEIPTLEDMSDNCQPDDNQVTAECQRRLGKDRLGKVSIGKGRIGEGTIATLTQNDIDLILKTWNELGLQQLRSIGQGTNRHTMLKARLKDYSIDEIIQAIESIKESPFLQGQNKRGWVITFDWFIKPNNFIKVLEGNYVDNKKQQSSSNPFLEILQEELKKEAQGEKI